MKRFETYLALALLFYIYADTCSTPLSAAIGRIIGIAYIVMALITYFRNPKS